MSKKSFIRLFASRVEPSLPSSPRWRSRLVGIRNRRAWEVEKPGIFHDFGRWYDGVARADVDLKRNPNVAEHGHELDAHAAVLLVLADRST